MDRVDFSRLPLRAGSSSRQGTLRNCPGHQEWPQNSDQLHRTTSRQKRVLKFATWLAGCSSPSCSYCPLSLPLQQRHGTARTKRHLRHFTWVTTLTSTPLREKQGPQNCRPTERSEQAPRTMVTAVGVTTLSRSSARRRRLWLKELPSAHSSQFLLRSSALEQSRTLTAPNGRAPCSARRVYHV